MNPLKRLLRSFTKQPTNKPVAVFDLDDTLINLKEILWSSLNEHYGNCKHWSQWETYGLEENVGITGKEIRKFANDQKLFRKIPPHTFSKSFLLDIKRRGYHIVIVTSREGFIQNAYRETERYLKEHELYYDELIVCPEGCNKTEYLTHHDTIHFAVDDQVRNCEDFASAGNVQHIFLHAVPHNQSCTQFVRLHNLFQLYPHVGLE